MWEFSYNVFAAHRNKGVATHAMEMLLSTISSELGRHDGIIRVYESNLPSKRVAEKLGGQPRLEENLEGDEAILVYDIAY